MNGIAVYLVMITIFFLLMLTFLYTGVMGAIRGSIATLSVSTLLGVIAVIVSFPWIGQFILPIPVVTAVLALVLFIRRRSSGTHIQKDA
ncbi:hypothetical protein CBW65_18680 [Tumebacillus avium]|uniref:Uncharacterized protein n=1 Tax=Tumebacillus avium TaxID=1903704 RepID=A0A1Y0IQA9_9BACL|nr:hypothetical protein [Tumebacillus avium]ARU62768.1 hypothetical protein CBW65_18680 [Tumebacillus avium]